MHSPKLCIENCDTGDYTCTCMRIYVGSKLEGHQYPSKTKLLNMVHSLLNFLFSKTILASVTVSSVKSKFLVLTNFDLLFLFLEFTKC